MKHIKRLRSTFSFISAQNHFIKDLINALTINIYQLNMEMQKWVGSFIMMVSRCAVRHFEHNSFMVSRCAVRHFEHNSFMVSQLLHLGQTYKSGCVC